jgi:hypothetical protein
VKDDIFSDPLNSNAPAGKKMFALSFARESHDWIELFQIFAKKASFCGNHGDQQTPLITLKTQAKACKPASIVYCAQQFGSKIAVRPNTTGLNPCRKNRMVEMQTRRPQATLAHINNEP